VFLSKTAFLRLINESKQNIDKLPGEDGTRLISESSYKRVYTDMCSVPVVIEHCLCDVLYVLPTMAYPVSMQGHGMLI